MRPSVTRTISARSNEVSLTSDQGTPPSRPGQQEQQSGLEFAACRRGKPRLARHDGGGLPVDA